MNELRLHGRGGQGGVTCAKLLASCFARLGMAVQTFGDYAGERAGAPVRAYLRVSDREIINRNKVYAPNHVVVLDPTLLGPDVLSGLAPGGVVLVNTPLPPGELGPEFQPFRVATVDATAIARRHRIGSRSVVIVNTTIAGAFARLFEIPLEVVQATYEGLGYTSNLPAAREAYDAVRVKAAGERPAHPVPPLSGGARVIPWLEALEGPPTAIPTGRWRTQAPHYATHLAPCSMICPAGNDVVGFVQALARSGEAVAAEVLARTTPFPGVCGRVCPAPCMSACNRATFDGPVNVRALERWISEHAQGGSARPAPAPAPRARRAAVIGSGPAGLSAARTLALAGHRVTLYERESALGGVLRTGIPAYRLPRKVIDREIASVLDLGVEARLSVRVDGAKLVELSREYDLAIVATGLQRLREVEGATSRPAGVEQGIHFLHRVNMGGDAHLQGEVVVLGGGNTAMDCARSAVRAGAKKVTVAYRRGREEMPANADEIAQAEAEGVQFVFLRQPLAFAGDGRLEAVLVAEVELGPPDASGRRRPVVTSRKERIGCDVALLALGQSADLSLLPEGWEMREGRAFAAGAPLNVFGAGDLSTAAGTVAHAIGDGRRIARAALAALDEQEAFTPPPDRASVVKPEEILHDFFSRAERDEERLAPADARRRDGSIEVALGLSSAREAARCFSCGTCSQCDRCQLYCPEGVIRREGNRYEVNMDFCKGCGVCVAECPRRAMEMVPS